MALREPSSLTSNSRSLKRQGLSFPFEVSLNLLHREQLPPEPPSTFEKLPLTRSICIIYLISRSLFLQKRLTSSASASSLDSLTTQFIFKGVSPALFAASIPLKTSFRFPLRVMNNN